MTIEPLAQACAAFIHERFHDYHDCFQRITQRAPERFKNRRWAHGQDDTIERLNLYANVVDRTESDIGRLLNGRVAEEAIWIAAKTEYANHIAGRDDRDLAETFFNSVTRRLFDTVGVNRRIEFIYDDVEPPLACPTESIFRDYPVAGDLGTVIRQILTDAVLARMDEASLNRVLPIIEEKVKKRLEATPGRARPVRIEMLADVFYRGQGAYLIGRILKDRSIVPLVFALLHPDSGVVVDALLLDADGVSIVFSFTRSAFHVTVKKPRELMGFLRSILPLKPEAELYSSLGYFKHGKTVLYRDVCHHTAQCTEERFRISPGKPGMVMVVFDLGGFNMVIKLIRDRFDTPKRITRVKVMEQYDFVFKHYRAGRLIEAHAFEHLRFERCWFSDDLLDFLLAEAGQTVHLVEERVIIDHAYLEHRVTPLDIYLKNESREKADAAVVDFGKAIKDLAAANIFPGDMLLKNFGVTRHGRVVFYDYDEIIPLTECRFRRIPPARSYMEEIADEPWYTVAENDVFPEEFSRFLGLAPRQREVFIDHHADLLAPGFWQNVQEEIRCGHIRHIRPYHPRYQLARE